MARTLMLRMDPTASEASWQLMENDKLVGPVGMGTLADARKAAHGAHVIALVPSEEIFLSFVTLPGKNRQKLLKAVPYVVEDQLVDDVEDLHFALSSHSDEGRYLVAAVEHRLMEYWDQALTAAGIRVEVLIPDAAALLATSEDWTVLLEPERAIVRANNGLFASDIQNLPMMLANLYQKAGEQKPAQVTVYDCSRSNHMASLQALTEGIEFNVVECTEGPFGVFVRHYVARGSVNLMQGEYSRKEHISKHLKPWIPAAALFCIWLAWQLVISIGEYIDLNSRSEQLTAEMHKVFKTAFRNSKPPAAGYERSYMEKQLNELLKSQGKSAGGLQEMLVRTAPALKNMQGININGMRYASGTLDIELTIEQASGIEALEKSISSQTGWDVKTQATTEKGITKVRLKITSKS